MNKYLLIILTPLFLLFSCLLEPSISDITVHNSSDNDILNISLTYHHGTKGKQVVQIDILQSGDTKTLSVITQDKALQTMETSVAIEYYINGIKFDSYNAIADDYGYAQIYGGIGSGLDTKFTIKNEGYMVQDIRK
jgi:hypothetical protein